MYIYNDGLQTERLATRFLVPADAAIWAGFLKDEQASRFATFSGYTDPADRAKAWIDFTLARYENERYGLQALIEKATGEFIGQCGLILQEVDGQCEVEVGYHLFPRYWGQGYATEAARAFRDYGFENNQATSIISVINPLNEPSKKVARRNGMRLVKEDGRMRDGSYNIFRITRAEWEALL